MKKIKKPNLPKLRRKAFKLWSEIVRQQGFCDVCGVKRGAINDKGKPIILHAHHLIGRENPRLALDIENGICLCVGHHKYYKDSSHKGGLIFHDWFMKKYPERYETLLKKSKEQFEINIENIQEIIKNLEKILNNSEATNV